MSEVGEDNITYCDACDYAANQEHSGLSAGDPCPKCGAPVKMAKGIEVGNIFKLGTKYSESMNAKFIDQNGKPKPVIMGCYGLGISRTLMASVEQHSTDNGIIWPIEIAPFKVHLIPVNLKDDIQKQLTYEIYAELKEKGIEVLLDDRAERAGVKFKDADLIGIPLRIVIGKDATEGKVEVIDRYNDKKEVVKKVDILDYI